MAETKYVIFWENLTTNDYGYSEPTSRLTAEDLIEQTSLSRNAAMRYRPLNGRQLALELAKRMDQDEALQKTLAVFKERVVEICD